MLTFGRDDVYTRTDIHSDRYVIRFIASYVFSNGVSFDRVRIFIRNQFTATAIIIQYTNEMNERVIVLS